MLFETVTPEMVENRDEGRESAGWKVAGRMGEVCELMTMDCTWKSAVSASLALTADPMYSFPPRPSTYPEADWLPAEFVGSEASTCWRPFVAVPRIVPSRTTVGARRLRVPALLPTV